MQEGIPGFHNRIDKLERLFRGDNWELPTDIDLVEPATRRIEDRAKKHGWNEQDTYNIQVSFREALINAIAHGNLQVEKPKDVLEPANWGERAKEKQGVHPELRYKKVKVVVKINRNKVFIQITDQGEGFDPKKIPDPLAPENLLKPSGRGIFMATSFFDSVEYDLEGRQITMIKERKE